MIVCIFMCVFIMSVVVKNSVVYWCIVGMSYFKYVNVCGEVVC